MATEVGQAYIQIIPSAKGISGSIRDIIDKEAGKAGKSGGNILSNGLKSGVSAFTVAAGTMIANMATSAARALGNIASSAMSVGANFETSLAKVQSISGGTAEQMAEFSKQVLSMSNATAQSADTINEAVYSVISATGAGMSDSMALVEQANQLATAGFADLDSSISVMTTAMNAYHMSVEDAAHISDSLITTQNLGVTTVAELSAAMGKAIATGGAYGISLENIESGYISLTKNGINTAESTTYMASMFKELADNGTEVGKVITSKTGKSFGTLMAEGYSLADALQIVSDSVDGDSEAMMNLWSSAEAGKASAAIMSQGIATFNENLETLRTSTGTTADAYETMTNTFQFKSSQLKNSVSNLGIMIYQGVGGPLAELTGIANEGVQGIAAAFEQGGASAVGPAVMNLFSNIGKWIIQKLPDATAAVNTLLEGVGSFISTNQTAITTAVTSVVSSVASNIPVVLPTLIPVGMSLLQGVIQGVFQTLPVITPQLITAAIQIVTMLVTGLVENIDIVINGFVTLLDGVGQALPQVDWASVGFQVMESIGSALQNASPGTIAVVAGIGTLMVGKFAASMAPMASIIAPMIAKASSGLSGMIGKLTSFGAAAGKTAPKTMSAGRSMGLLTKNALGLVAAGAGILLAAAGLALLAHAAIGIAQAGPGAAIALVGMIAALAGLAVGAAAIAPALTAGAVGLVAFGAALVLVGAGVLMACGGMAILATQLPTITTYGASAAINIAELGAAMLVFAPGAIAGGAAAVVAGTGLLTMSAGLLAAGAGALVAAAGVAALGAALTLVGSAITLLGVGFVLCAAGLQNIGAVADTASAGFGTLAEALGAAFLPMAAGTVSCGALALAIGALDLVLIGLTVTLATSAASAALLGASMGLVAGAVTTICDSATEAAQAMQNMVDGVDIVKNGLNGLKDMATGAVNAFVDSFKNASPTATAAATAMAAGISMAVQTGMFPLPVTATAAMTTFILAISSTVGEARNAGFQVAGGAALGMSGMPAKLGTIARSSTMAVRSAFTSVNWMGVGIQIDNGIASGMTSGEGVGAIERAARTVAERALRAAKQALDIGSPSKLMRDEVGRWIPEGIAEGITGNMDSVSDAMSGIGNYTMLKDRLKLGAFAPGQMQADYAAPGTNVTQNNTFYTHDSLSERELCQQTENMAARLRWKLG